SSRPILAEMRGTVAARQRAPRRRYRARLLDVWAALVLLAAVSALRLPPRSVVAVLRDLPRSLPVSLVYVVVVAGTTMLLRAVSPATGRHLLAAASTNVAHPERDPLTVLTASAFWLPGSGGAAIVL